MVWRVLRPFGRIDVAEVDQRGQLRMTAHVLRHGRREHDRRIDLLFPDRPVHPGLEAGIAVVRQG